MTHTGYATLLCAAGVAQLGILCVGALVPFRLNWRTVFGTLPRLHEQMYWVYAGYVVMSIIAFALLSLFNAQELANGSGLARGLCFYIAVFWGVRAALQGVYDVSTHLPAWWLRAGYSTMTVVFALLATLYGWVALGVQ